MHPLRVGIIGCGVIGPSHVESYQALDGVEVTWVCDLVEEKARDLARRYGIARTTTDFEEVMADSEVDAVSVCTDHASHAPVTVAALEAGKHVLCEKALAAGAEALDAMFDAAAARPDQVFSAVFQHRFDQVYREVKRLVDYRRFGTILTAAVQVHCLRTEAYYRKDPWRGTWSSEGGAVLINQAIHFIDILVWIMGGVESLCGAFSNLTHRQVMETEDTAAAVLRFRKGGALGTLEATCSSNLPWESTISVHGERGSLDLRDGKPLKLVFEDKNEEEEARAALLAARDEATIGAGKSYYGPSHPSQIADYVAAIREGRKPFVTALSARHTVDVVHAIYRSAREERWVRIGGKGDPEDGPDAEA